ncbi:unnamed protein product [Somion occarium]|uniref:Uncharacterized protein n=1 Tax=Somion occarium TaxID=3059160 RepID=A0ABP1D163_9APHY
MTSYGVPLSGRASPLPQYAQPIGVQQPQYPAVNPQGAQINPGTITYTTTTGPDGQVIYHPFRAVPASYQTASGIVSGIQWVPAEATSVLPTGAMPATGDVLASVDRVAGGDRSRDWQRDDDRYRDNNYRRRDDRDRSSRAWDRRDGGPDDYRRDEDDYRRREDRDLRRAQERDERERQRLKEHRMSQAGSMYGSGGYDRKYNDGVSELEQRFQDLDVDRDRSRRDRDYERDSRAARSRRGSMYGGVPGGSPYSNSATPALGYQTASTAGYGSSPYSTSTNTAGYPPTNNIYSGQRDDGSGIRRPVSPYQQGVTTSPYQTGSAISRPVSPYRGIPPLPSSYAQQGSGQARPVSPYRGVPPVQRAASPYHAGGVLPPASPYHGGGALPRSSSPYHGAVSAPRPVSPMPVYPPGHIMAGKPMTRNSVAGYGSQNQGYGSSPHIPSQTVDEQRMLPPPEGFSRPPNLAQPYTAFETLRIQDMDEFFENIPRMPLVLVTHDVYHEDWIRFMTDLSLAWGGKLPVPEYARDGGPLRRTILTADLIDLWNASFFIKRGVEAVLYKGRERKSGPNVGVFDAHLPGFEGRPGYSESDEDETDDSEDEDDLDDRHRGYGAYGGVYGRQVDSQMAEYQEARRIRRERKRAEKKRRRQERRHRRKLREAERKYALYITCVPPRDVGVGM